MAEILELKIKRIAKRLTYTIGKLSVDGVYFCDTLEDTERPQSKGRILNKIHGKTAIPIGRYRVTISYSNKFKKRMIQILNVPDFEGIRIHAGVDASHSEGCPLVGFNKEVGKLTGGFDVSQKLFLLVEEAINNGKEVFITIE